MTVYQQLRDNLWYGYGYLQGRNFALPRSVSGAVAGVISKTSSALTLPLPLLSFVALPFFGGSPATISLVFFYLTWSALVLSHDPLVVEIYGTLVVRLIFFLLPALAFLAFDVLLSGFSKNVKVKGARHLPHGLGRDRLLWLTGVAVFNVLLGVALQATFETVATKILRIRSLVRVTTLVPLPWSVFIHMLKGLAVRGVLHYAIHRFLLHTYDSPLKSWHLSWQHSVTVPFSIVAAYDHPVNYILAVFVPAFAPAVLFRWHVLEWQLFQAIVSVEDLLIYSGYSVLPSRIILSGMARRMEAHFECVRKRKPNGNFGHLGIMDLIVGTTCQDEVDVLDDVQDEASKHRIQERIEDAVHAALQEKGGRSSGTRKRNGSTKSHDEDEDYAPERGSNNSNDTTAAAAPRRGGRRRWRKD